MQTERGTKYCSRKISKFWRTKRLFKWTDSNNLYLALSGKWASVHHIDFLLLRPKYYAILYRFKILFVTKHPLVGESYICELWTCSTTRTSWMWELAIATQLWLCSTSEKSIYRQPSAPFWTRLVHSWNDECCRSVNNRKNHWQTILITSQD